MLKEFWFLPAKNVKELYSCFLFQLTGASLGTQFSPSFSLCIPLCLSLFLFAFFSLILFVPCHPLFLSHYCSLPQCWHCVLVEQKLYLGIPVAFQGLYASQCNELCHSAYGGVPWSLEKAMATHSSTLAWKIPWTEEPGSYSPCGIAKSRTRLSDFTFTFTVTMVHRTGPGILKMININYLLILPDNTSSVIVYHIIKCFLHSGWFRGIMFAVRQNIWAPTICKYFFGFPVVFEAKPQFKWHVIIWWFLLA